MKDRIALIMSVKNLSPTELADRLKVQRSSISHILSERNKPSLEFMLKIVEAFPDLSLDWVFRGEGAMLKSQVESMQTAYKPSALEKMPIDLFENDDNVPKAKSNVVVNEDNKLDSATIASNSIKQNVVVSEEEQNISHQSISNSEITETTEATRQHTEQENTLKKDNVELDKTAHLNTEAIQSQSSKGKKVIAWVAIYNDNTFRMYDLATGI